MKKNWEINSAALATGALITFLTSHDLQVDPGLIECREALSRNDVPAALKAAYSTKPLGMGGIMDQVPLPKSPDETEQYLLQVLEALVGHWMRHISLIDSEHPLKDRLSRFIRKWKTA